MNPTQTPHIETTLINDLFAAAPEESSILHVSVALDASSGLAYSSFGFKRVNGGSDTLLLRRDDALDAGRLMKELRARNAILPTGDKEAKAMLHEIARKEPLQSFTHEPCLGWNAIDNFVTLDRVLCNGRESANLAPPLWLKGRPPLQLKRSGTSKIWTRRIGRFALSSSRVALALSASFAAPLLKIEGKNSFAIVLYGKSRTGKTTAALAAASVIGIDTENAMPNWNITEAGFQQTARLFNDQLFPMNEMALIRSGGNGAYSQIRDFTYKFGEGVEILRHSESNYATSGVQSTWRSIMLTTNEHSIDAMAMKSGTRRDEGEQARAFCVPAVAEGYRTVIDCFPAAIDDSSRDEWSQKRFARLRRDAISCHGVVFDDYITFLMEKGHANIRETVAVATEDFVSGLEYTIDSPALRDVARNFGIIYAGGLLAIEAGFLPIKGVTLLRSIRKCLRDGLNALTPIRDIEKDAVEQFRNGVNSAKWPPRLDVVNASKAAAFTFVRKKADSEPCRAVTTVTFQSWFGSKAHTLAALHWLHLERLLVLPDGTDPTKAEFSIEAVTKNVKVNGESTRCIVFHNPSKALKGRQKASA